MHFIVGIGRLHDVKHIRLARGRVQCVGELFHHAFLARLDIHVNIGGRERPIFVRRTLLVQSLFSVPLLDTRAQKTSHA